MGALTWDITVSVYRVAAGNARYKQLSELRFPCSVSRATGPGAVMTTSNENRWRSWSERSWSDGTVRRL